MTFRMTDGGQRSTPCPRVVRGSRLHRESGGRGLAGVDATDLVAACAKAVSAPHRHRPGLVSTNGGDLPRNRGRRAVRRRRPRASPRGAPPRYRA